MDPLVSVIIPVYRAERFLQRCIDSILLSSYKDLEVILIDDGSPDQCGKICDQYTQKDNRCIVVHQKNQGVSAARNHGLKISKGEYISFVDADDYISPELFQKGIHYIQQQKADLLIFNAQFHPERGASNYVGWQILNFDYTTMQIKTKMMLGDDAYLWRKLYRRCLWETLSFPKGQTYEDEYVNIDLIERAQKIVAIPDVLYFYEKQNNHSITKQRSIQNLEGEFLARRHCYTQALKFYLHTGYAKFFKWNTWAAWAMWAYHLQKRITSVAPIPKELNEDFMNSTQGTLNRPFIQELQLFYYISSAKGNYYKYKILCESNMDHTYVVKSAARYMIRALTLEDVDLQISKELKMWMETMLKTKEFAKGMHINQKILLWEGWNGVNFLKKWERKKMLGKGI